MAKTAAERARDYRARRRAEAPAVGEMASVVADLVVRVGAMEARLRALEDRPAVPVAPQATVPSAGNLAELRARIAAVPSVRPFPIPVPTGYGDYEPA